MHLPTAGTRADPRPAPAGDHRGYRLTAIDFVRGLAIVIMALDHTRDYFMVGAAADPLAGGDVPLALFATRWITHFCAPVFVLLAGTSAGLMAARKSRGELGRFLVTRGLWLVAIEMTVVATAWTFAPRGIPQLGGLTLTPMGVIWVIGASMVVLSAVQWLGRPACFVLGVVIVVGHNLLDPVWPASRLFDQQWPLWVALHSQMSLPVDPLLLRFRYPLLAWVGVMLLGFGSSRMFELDRARRSAILLTVGGVATIGFCLLRAAGIYGDPNPWHVQPGGAADTVMDFLNVTKYPPSLLFLMMTLGPAAILCAFADRISGAVADRAKGALVVFGRAPFAFYVAHLYVLHAGSVLLGVIQGFSPDRTMTSLGFYPSGFGVSLPAVYLVWAVVVAVLYPLCLWVAEVKARRRDWWLSFV